MTARRLEAIEGYVRWVRAEVFGGEDPPFSSFEDPPAAEWVYERFERGMDGRTTRADRVLGEAIRRLSRGTGFAGRDVYEFIVTGKRPHLANVQTGAEAIKEPLSDGTVLRRTYGTVTIHRLPSAADWMKLYRRLSRALTAPDALPDFHAAFTLARRARGGGLGLTALDRTVLAFVEGMPDATWRERAAAWEREQGQSVEASTFAVRYSRAKQKLAKLEPQPEAHDER